MQKILNHAVLLFFIFPYIPSIVPGGLQPFFIVLLLVAILFRGSTDWDAIWATLALCLLSFLGISSSTATILFGTCAYILTISFMSRLPLNLIYLWVRIKLFFLSITAIVYSLIPDLFGNFRYVLGLRNPYAEYFSEVYPEHSFVLISMMLLYVVICGLNLGLKRLYFLTCIPIIVAGSLLSSVIFVIPLICEIFSKVFRVDQFKVLIAGALSINLSILIIGLFPNYFDILLILLHRSEQVRLYDLAMITRTLLEDPLSLKTFGYHMTNTETLFPERFKDNFFGTTSAAGKIAIELGLPGILVLFFFCKRYIRSSLFFVSILTSIGIGWTMISLLAAKRRDEL
jgi:hypothetical protein